jgi:hypothetical protein
VLDLSDDWLLLSINRHPEGGSPVEHRQYWLYSRQQRTVYFLHIERVAEHLDGAWRVQRGDGVWRPVDNRLEQDFFETINTLVDPHASKLIQRASVPSERLCHLSSEVLEKCQLIAGIDYAAQDKRHGEMREMKYQKKYGPRGPGLILISTVSPNLIYSKEPRHG